MSAPATAVEKIGYTDYKPLLEALVERLKRKHCSNLQIKERVHE